MLKKLMFGLTISSALFAAENVTIQIKGSAYFLIGQSPQARIDYLEHNKGPIEFLLDKITQANSINDIENYVKEIIALIEKGLEPTHNILFRTLWLFHEWTYGYGHQLAIDQVKRKSYVRLLLYYKKIGYVFALNGELLF